MKKKPRRGRPPLDPADALSETLRVRFTPGEMARVKAGAKAQKESISDYARRLILDVPQKVGNLGR